MFKNDKDELEHLKQQIAGGSVDVPTELETLMNIESQEIIRDFYDNTKGNEELFKVMKANKDKSQSLLAMTKFDKKIKLTQMKMTWEFTRTIPMFIHFAETFYYMLIS
jgi:hypothetical protein